MHRRSLTRREADPIVQRLVDQYKDIQKSLSPGIPFTEAYDLETLQPKDLWQRMYDQAVEEMRNEYGLAVEN